MKLKIESIDNKAMIEKGFDIPQIISEKDFWTLYCRLINLTKNELSETEINMLVFIFLDDPNESLFNTVHYKDLMNMLDCSQNTFFKYKRKLIADGFLVPEDDEFPHKNVMLNNQLSRFQKKVKELVRTNNLKSIQLNFNLQIK
jgi:hypothetical protein